MRAAVLLQLTVLHFGCWVTPHREVVRSVFEEDPLVQAHLAEEGPDWSLVPPDPECDHQGNKWQHGSARAQWGYRGEGHLRWLVLRVRAALRRLEILQGNYVAQRKNKIKKKIIEYVAQGALWGETNFAGDVWLARVPPASARVIFRALHHGLRCHATISPS